MSALSVRVASGPEAAKIASENMRAIARRDEWPFPWVYPGPESKRRNPANAINAPAAVASAVVLEFTVPQGYVFELIGIMFGVYGSNYQPQGNPGDYTFTVTRNQPLLGTVPQGSTVADFYQFPFFKGSPQQGPVTLARSETFAPNDTIRVIVTSLVGGGVGNVACAELAGWQRKA